MILADGFSSGSVLSIVFSSLLVIGIVLIFIGFINNMFKMIFGSPTTDIPRGEVSKFTIAAMLFLLFFVLVVSIYVPPVLNEILHNIYDIVRECVMTTSRQLHIDKLSNQFRGIISVSKSPQENEIFISTKRKILWTCACISRTLSMRLFPL